MNKTCKTLYNLIEDVVNRPNVTPNNEVLIPIPKSLVDSKEPSVIDFIKRSGQLHKDKNLPIKVKMEPKRTVHDDKVYETINFIFKFTTDIDLDTLRISLGLTR
ncbi:hypothetical protein [Mammaliicoccus virus vB_MscM-PMS2]|nr:hypothetical protein [Mammaliicoccus virus vB_MscM-PMS2]